MPYTHRPARWLALLGLAAGLTAQPVSAQTRLPKPTIYRPGSLAGPTSLTAWSNTPGQVWLAWPPVAGAQAYRVTRVENAGDPEATMAELPPASYVFEGANCSTTSGQPGCVFQDVTNASPGRVAGTPKIPDPGVISAVPVTYPHTVESGKQYTYRVYAILAGPTLSSPSPPASVRVR